MRHDRIAGAALSLAAVSYLFEARSFETGFIADPIGPKAFPYVLGTLLLLLGVVLVARPGADATWPSPVFWWRWVVATAAFFVYARLLEPLGFVASTSLLVTLFSLLLGGRFLKSVLFALGFSLAVYIVFRHFLTVALPPGSFFFGGG